MVKEPIKEEEKKVEGFSDIETVNNPERISALLNEDSIQEVNDSELPDIEKPESVDDIINVMCGLDKQRNILLIKLIKTIKGVD